MSDDGMEDRTEEPSQHRRDELRKAGDILQSREVVGSLLMLATTGALYGAAQWSLSGVWSVFTESLSELGRTGLSDWSPETVAGMSVYALRAFAFIVAPVALASLVAGIVGSVAQTGFVWTTKPLEPDLEKLNPGKGLGKLFSLDSLFEMAKAVVKFIVVGSCVYPFLMRWTKESGGLYGSEAAGLARYLGFHLMEILFVVGLAMFVLSALDYGFQRFRYERRIRMTKQEVREERKQVEGNPQIRARIRGLQRNRAQQRMMEDVKKADVVITNPTHFAIAIIYDRESMLAPKIVAKGADHMALKIKEIARANGIPCVENPPLARAMFKALKIGQFISRDLYNAVAEVLAYVYRLKGRVQ